MATIAKLAIQLTASTGKLTKQLGAVSKSFTMLSRGIMSSVFSIQGAIVGLAGTAGLQAVIDRFEDIGDAASRLGVGVEELQKLQIQAELSGSSAQALTLGLQRMSRRLSETAETGGGPAKAALDSLGLSIQNLQGLSPDQQFLVLADAISKVPDKGQQLLNTFRLFDTEGVSLINMLRSGSGAITEFGDNLKDAGFVMSGEGVRSLQQLASVIKLFSTRMAVLVGNILVQFSDQIIDTIFAIVTLTLAIQDLVIKHKDTIASMIKSSVATLTFVSSLLILSSVITGLSKLIATITTFLAVGGTSLVAGIAGIIALIGGILVSVFMLSRSNKETADAFGVLEDSIESVAHNKALSAMREQMKGLGEEMTKLVADSQELENTQRVIEGFDKSQRIMDKLNSEIIDLRIELGELEKFDKIRLELIAAGADKETANKVKETFNTREALQARVDAMNEARRAEEQRVDSINSMVSSLEKEVSVFGMTQTQIRDYELALLGANDATRTYVHSLGELLDTQEQIADLTDRQKSLNENLQFQTKKGIGDFGPGEFVGRELNRIFLGDQRRVDEKQLTELQKINQELIKLNKKKDTIEAGLR